MAGENVQLELIHKYLALLAKEQGIDVSNDPLFQAAEAQVKGTEHWAKGGAGWLQINQGLALEEAQAAGDGDAQADVQAQLDAMAEAQAEVDEQDALERAWPNETADPQEAAEAAGAERGNFLPGDEAHGASTGNNKSAGKANKKEQANGN